MRGAGGTPGGVGSFFIGLTMAAVGAYLLLANIHVSSGFSMAYPLYRLPFGTRMGVPAGSLLIPFLVGVGGIFMNAKSLVGWVLAVGALVAMVFGVLMSLHITLVPMSLLQLLTILVLVAGGLGLFAKSLRAS